MKNGQGRLSKIMRAIIFAIVSVGVLLISSIAYLVVEFFMGWDSWSVFEKVIGCVGVYFVVGVIACTIVDVIKPDED